MLASVLLAYCFSSESIDRTKRLPNDPFRVGLRDWELIGTDPVDSLRPAESQAAGARCGWPSAAGFPPQRNQP